jgi:two-component system cell cycle response regulator
LLTRLLADAGCVVPFDEHSALDAARAGEIALLIVAPQAAGWAGASMFAALLAEVARHEVALFAMVPQGDTAALARAFDGGAADCGNYPIEAEEIRIRIRSLLQRKAIADQLRLDAAEVRRIAHTDPVTGLRNRHYLDTELAARIALTSVLGCPLSLLMIDIDRFKPINDRHGHAIGDKVLRAVANRLSAGIREIDTLARYGGDELALIMPDTGIDTARAVAERLRALVADGTTEVPFQVTISIGVAELNAGQSALALLARADAALYAAKSGGRDRVAAAS